MLKLLYLVGTTLAVGLVWFFALSALVEQALGLKLGSFGSTALLIACAAAGAIVGWKLFVSPKQHG